MLRSVGDMINKAQQEFLHGHSCVTQLLYTLHHTKQLLDRNIQTDVLFFAKPSIPLITVNQTTFTNSRVTKKLRK